MMASQVPNSTANQDVHALTQKFSGILPITPFKPKLQRCALDPKIRTQYSKNLVFFARKFLYKPNTFFLNVLLKVSN